MKEIVLIKNGELVLKGLNRNTFEDILIKNMKKALREIGEFTFTKSQSTIMLESADEETDLDEAVEALSKVFGIAALSRAAVAEKNMENIMQISKDYLSDELSFAKEAIRDFL